MDDVRVTGDTWGSLFATGFLVMVALLPLQNTVLPRIFPAMAVWPDWSFAMGLYLLLAYGWLFFTRRFRIDLRVVSYVAGFGLLIILGAAAGERLPDAFAVYRLAVVLWAIPLMALFARGKTGHILLTTGLVAVLLLHAQWAIVQFAVQHDIGLQTLGETVITPATDGVAKFMGAGGKLVRAYGPYPHSNDLSGSMVVGLVILLLFAYEFRGLDSKYGRVWWVVVAAFFVLGALLSFSRAAYIGVGLWLIVSHVLFARTGKGWRAMKSVWLVIFLVFMVCWPLIQLRLADSEDVASVERVSGFEWSLALIRANPAWRGVGLGRYVPALQEYLVNTNVSVPFWQLAPVHSVPLLAISELGVVVPLAMFAIFLAVCLRWANQRMLLLLPLVPMLLLDHYFYSHTAPLLLLASAVTLVMLDWKSL